jgi:hypothetical protein
MTACITSLYTSSAPFRAGAAPRLLHVAVLSSFLLLLGRTAGAGVVDSGNSNNKRRYLPSFSNSFSDDTTAAPLSAGNPVAACGGALGTCVNGCKSHFYKVSGGNGIIVADTCGSDHQIYVWKGGSNSSSGCSAFACTGTYTCACA